MDVGGNTSINVERKATVLPVSVMFYGSGDHYSGKSSWNIDDASCKSNYVKIDTTFSNKPEIWMQGALFTDTKGAEFTATGQKIAAALQSLRFRLDSLPMDIRGVNLIDSPNRPLGIEFVVDKITNTYDAAAKQWNQKHTADTIIPDGSAFAYCSARMFSDPLQTLVNPMAHPIKIELLFRLRIILQEPKNIEPSNIYINGTAGALIQY